MKSRPKVSRSPISKQEIDVMKESIDYEETFEDYKVNTIESLNKKEERKRGMQSKQTNGKTTVIQQIQQQQQYPQNPDEIAFLSRDKIPRTPIGK